jgi:two-component system NarL family response regulator
MDVVGVASDAVTAVAEAERLHPEVALVDVDLPKGGGIHATRLIRMAVPECKVVVVANQDHDATLARAIEAGAAGALTKFSPLAEVIGTIRGVHGGRTMIPEEMLGNLLSWLIGRRADRDEARRRFELLSRRERRVLALLTQGANNQRISEILSISPQTARTHVQHAMLKLGVHSRLEAVAFVTRNGMADELEMVDS